MPGRLFDAPKVKRAKWTGNVLPVLAPPLCPAPRCRQRLVYMSPVVQPALFYHGGYGAAERTTFAVCAHCGWFGTAKRESVNPRRL